MIEGRTRIGCFIATLLAAGAFLIIVAATVSAAEGPAVMITSYTVEPTVLMPGDTGTIIITLKNMDTQSQDVEQIITSSLSGSQTTTSTRSISAKIESIQLNSRNREIEWLEERTQRNEYFKVGALGPGESIPIALPIKVAGNADSDTYYPEVYIEVDNGDNVRFPVPVMVDSSEVTLLAKDIPSVISLTESKAITFEVVNNRPNIVNGVNVFVNSNGKDFEFKPEAIFIGSLGGYSNKTVSFTLTPRSEGTKDISFEVTYKNGNNEHSSMLTSSVEVKSGSAVKLILVDAPDFVFKGDVAEIDFDVANGMTRDIKAVSVVPMREGAKILPSEYFIGDMEVGDVFSASFDLYTGDLASGETTIPFKLVFTDIDTDRQYEIAGYEVQVEVREPQKSGLQTTMLVGGLVAVIVIVAVVLWFRARQKRARELS